MPLPRDLEDLRKEQLHVAWLQEATRVAGLGMFHHDHHRDEIYWSPEMRAIHGVGLETPITISLIVTGVVEADRARIDEAIRHAHDPSGDGRFDVEYRIVRPNGEVRWIASRSQTYFEGTRPKRTIGATQDITERKQTEAAMRLRDQAMETALNGIAISDASGRLVYVNPAFVSMFGYASREELIGRLAVELSPGGAEVIASVRATGGWAGERNGTRKDGSTLPLHMLASAVTDGDGNVTAMMGSFIDLTERKRAEEERARLAAVLDATPDVVGIADPSGNVLYLNQAARAMFGLSDAAPTGKMGDHHTPASRSTILETAIPSAVKTGAWRGETNLIDPSGREVPFSQVVIAHRGPDGAPLYFATIARDISEQRELEAQLRQAQKMEAIGRLAGGVAHDFNNLLSVILSFARLVHDDLPEGHPSRPELEQIERAGERAADLTRQMLAFSRKQVLQPRVVDANDVLLAMAPMIERLVGEDLELQLALAPAPCLLKVDPPQLEQAVLNLVVNARDAMPSGGRLTIETGLVEIDESYARTHLDVRPGPHVLIAVSDTGVGMDAATKERIFEPFFTTKGPGIGTGLGLSTVFGIVRQTGGTIWVYSEPGRGTTFKLYFPRTGDPAVLHQPAPRTIPMASLRGRTVLVVEDEPQLRDVVVSVLRRAGLIVLEAARPDDALDLAASHDGPIHLLLTDVVMPGLNGKQLADRLLATRPTTRVVYMSGYTENTIVHHGVLDTGVDFLPKPVVPDALLAIVQRILSAGGRL